MIVQNRRGLSESDYRDMLKMLRTLTPQEKRMLQDPSFITEDEADLIDAMRANHGPWTSLDDLRREHSIEPRKRA